MDIKELFVESIMDNKKLIIGLYALFIIAFIASWLITAPKMGSIAGNVPVSSSPGGDTSPVELFIHNEWGGIVTYFGSIFFAIPAVVMVFYNAFNIAAIGLLFANIMPNGSIMYILYLIPHGIFEITGMILQSVAGILLFLFIWRFVKALRSSDTNGVSDAFEMTKKALIQSVVLMVIATVLTLVAAPIESYVSIPFSQVIMGIFGLM
jgi:uncharacterized membrane protein SpoIIM required for sporulation